MELLKEISDKTIGLGEAESFFKPYKLRKAARAVVFDPEKRIAVLAVTKHKYHKLPGGGLEGDEEIHRALVRELLEEAGAPVEIGESLGITIEYRDRYEQIQISYAYLAAVSGPLQNVEFTQEEIEDGFELKWMTLGDATDRMEADDPRDYIGKYVRLRDLAILREAEKRI
ncbi:NUDIX domain-containing protein [Candidatus Nomurabacteria bacterium]|nr:NUDIX domain-containing protein [Candidatus Nomurabacteria bacterium]